MPISALVVARDDGRLGAHVTRSTADCVTAEKERAATIAQNDGSLARLLQTGKGLPCAIMPMPVREAGTIRMRANGASMAVLARLLTSATNRMVEDQTGLSGLYDWEMAYDPAETLRAEPQSGSNASIPTPTSESPSLLTALREQLGLTLRSVRGPVEVLVIDSAALPEPD